MSDQADYWETAWRQTERMLAKVTADREALVDRLDTAEASLRAATDELDALAALAPTEEDA